jgi:tetratricopeptide (TPR) repeat protein
LQLELDYKWSAFFYNLTIYLNQKIFMRLPALILFLLQVFIFSSAKPQSRTIDSLRSVYFNEKNDSARVVALCRISNEYYSDNNPDSAMHYAQQGLNLATRKGLKKGQAQSLSLIGSTFFSISDFPNALEAYLLSLRFSEEINDQVGIGASTNNIAEVYKEQGDYTHALEYYLKAKEIYELMLKDLESEKNRNEAMIRRISEFLIAISLNIGDNYERMNQLDSALLYQSRAQSQAIMINDKDYIGAVLSNLGFIYLRKGMNPEALLSYRLSIPHLLAIDDNIFLANAYYGIAILFQKTGPADTSIFYSQKSLDVASKGGNQKEMLNAASLLAELYEKTGDDKKALAYLKQSKAISDSIFNLAKVNKLYSLRIGEKFRQQQQNDARVKTEKERKRNLQNLAIFIFLIPLFGVFFKIGGKKLHEKMMEILGLMGLLLLFEFISVFINPYLVSFTKDNQVYILLFHVFVAGMLIAIYNPLRKWVGNYLVQRKTYRR